MKADLLQRNLAIFACLGIAVVGCGGGSNPGGNGGSGSGGNGGSNSGGSTAYTLGGTLTGLSPGESVSLQDNGGNTLALSANGAYSFPMSLNSGSAYSVTVQSHTPGIACSVSNGSGTVGSANVTADVSCSAGTERVLYSFGASATDGQNPIASLIMDSAGNLYGTTLNGGANGGTARSSGSPVTYGTAFKIGADGTESVLHSFGANATDGQSPFGGLIMDSAGNLYGTTEYGGANGQATGMGDGTVFKISASGTESVFYSFGATATDGVDPMSGLIIDGFGNFYGTTYGGGTIGYGTVFKINASGTESILYSFGVNASDGRGPSGGLIMDSAGNLYGTTFSGGTIGNGTVFKIDPAGAETILHSFGPGGSDGAWPEGNLIMDSAGSLYGTTSGAATVFKLSPGSGGTYTETILYFFPGGEAPHAGLILDGAGNLYGTTDFGGVYEEGTVFKLTLDVGGTYMETIVNSFSASATDGQRLLGSLITDSAGNLYGTTAYGGTYGPVGDGYGTIFVIN